MHRRTLLKTITAGVPLLMVRGIQQPARGGTTLILLGTQGGPTVTLTRSETAALIVTGGQPYLVDCGYGALRGLVQAGIRNADVRNIFLTHLHDDHTADLAAILSHKWTGGGTNPPRADVYGPFGTKQMVDGAMAFFRPSASPARARLPSIVSSTAEKNWSNGALRLVSLDMGTCVKAQNAAGRNLRPNTNRLPVRVTENRLVTTPMT